MLDERPCWSSKGTFLLSPPMSHPKIGPVDPGVGQEINGNQIQDGGCSSHLGWVVELIIERNLPLVTPNMPQKNWINRPRRLSCNWWKPNPRWCCRHCAEFSIFWGCFQLILVPKQPNYCIDRILSKLTPSCIKRKVLDILWDLLNEKSAGHRHRQCFLLE
jgi:hypothetical protein